MKILLGTMSRLALGLCLGMLPALAEPAGTPAPAPAAEADGYELQFDFLSNLGDSYRLESKATFEMQEKRFAKGMELASSSRKAVAELKGIQTVLALSQNHRASKVKVAVEAFSVVSDGAPILEAKAGDQLEIERMDAPRANGDNFLVTLNGQELSGPVAYMASLLVETVPPKERSSSNPSYQPAGKKKPGEAWPVNSRAFIENVIKPFLGPDDLVKDDQVQGTVTFQKIVDDPTGRYARVQVDLACTDILPKSEKGKIVSSEGKSQGYGYIPLDKGTRHIIGGLETVRKNVLEEEMGTAANAWKLRRELTSTTHQTSRAIFIAPGK